VEIIFMNNRPHQAKVPEAIVVINALGTAVDCNNTFARLCHTPAGMLVGQQLSGFAPELAAVLENGQQLADDTVMTVGDKSFTLAVEPFAADSDAGSDKRAASELSADRIVRLRDLSWDEVA